jgi:hypothetical protein
VLTITAEHEACRSASLAARCCTLGQHQEIRRLTAAECGLWPTSALADRQLTTLSRPWMFLES